MIIALKILFREVAIIPRGVVNRDWFFSRDIKTVLSSLTSVAVTTAVARKGAIDGVDCGVVTAIRH